MMVCFASLYTPYSQVERMKGLQEMHGRDHLWQMRQPIREVAYDAWKRRIWSQPFSGGLAGYILVIVAVTVTLAGMVAAAIVYNSSSHVRAPIWSKVAAFVMAGSGALSFMFLRPVVWRLTGEYREARKRENQTLYLLRYEATPSHDHPNLDEYAGAIVNGWVYADDEVEANLLAQVLIGEAGWIVDEPDEIRSVDCGTLEDDDPHLPYIAQARLDSEVFLFHTWLVDELDSAED